MFFLVLGVDQNQTEQKDSVAAAGMVQWGSGSGGLQLQHGRSLASAEPASEPEPVPNTWAKNVSFSIVI